MEFKNILEEISYWLDKGGKEGLFNHFFLRERLKETLKGLWEREKGISPLIHTEVEYLKNLKICNLSKEELLGLLETEEYKNCINY